MLKTEQSARVGADEELSTLSLRIADLESEASQIREKLETMYLRYPPLPEVMRFKRGEHVWFTDGYMAVRGGWPGEFADRDSESIEKSGHKLIDTWEGVGVPVRVLEVGGTHNGEVVILSNGAYLNREMFDRLMRLGRWDLYAESETSPVVFKDQDGEVVAGQMPITGSRTLLYRNAWRLAECG